MGNILLNEAFREGWQFPQFNEVDPLTISVDNGYSFVAKEDE